MTKNEKLAGVIQKTGAFNCVECGKCTSLCPITRVNPDFAPRLMVVKAQAGNVDDILGSKDLWQCLTCGRCSQKCPYKVKYNDFVRALREMGREGGTVPGCSEGGLLRSAARLMARGDLPQKRLGWVGNDLKTAQKGDVLLFTGCAPYLSVIFGEKDPDVLNAPRAAVSILNKLGIVPVVGNGERCCGHDEYWTGDTETFGKLARLNIEWIKSTGASTVIVTCPECFRTLLKEYKKVDPSFDVDVLHISEFLADKLEDGKLQFNKEVKETITYHDGCRMGRHIGVIDEPRMLLEKVPGLKLVEMEASGEDTSCCGVSAFSGCDTFSKDIQVERLKEAKATGATAVLMFCPKCRIHFKCALKGKLSCAKEDVDVRIADFLEILDRAL